MLQLLHYTFKRVLRYQQRAISIVGQMRMRCQRKTRQVNARSTDTEWL